MKKILITFMGIVVASGCASTQSADKNAEPTGRAVDNAQAEERMKEVAKEAVSNEAASDAVEPHRAIIQPDKAAAAVKDEQAPLIDVRDASQFNARHLPGAKNIPLADIEKDVAKVAALNGGDKTKPVVVYCNTGRTAAKAKAHLESQGFTNVISAGGLDDWPEKKEETKSEGGGGS
jgi:phage shock protein E